MYGTFSLIRYSTTRSEPRISAMLLPFRSEYDRLYDAPQDRCGLADSVLERRQRRVEPRLGQLVRERQDGFVVRDLRARNGVFDEGDEVRHRRRRPPNAEGPCAGRRRPRSLDERSGDVAGVVELRRAAESDPVRLAADGS